MMTEVKLPIFLTAWQSWRGGWRAMRAMPKMTTILFVLIVADFVLDLLLAPEEFEGLVVWRQLARLALVVLLSLLFTPPCIAFYRYLLLGEVTQRYVLDFSSPRTRMYFCYTAVFACVSAVCLNLTETAGAFLSAMGFITSALVLLFPQMLFPAIAIDAPQADIANAFQDIRPRALVIGAVAVLLWILVPYALVFVFGFLLVLLFELATGVELPAPSGTLMAAPLVVFYFVFVMIWLEITTRFYRAWAHRLGRPAGIVDQI